MPPQSIAYIELTEGLVVFVGGKTLAGHHEWQEHLRFVEALAERARTTGLPLHFLVFAQDGGAPDAAQRVALVESLRAVNCRTALITESMIARHLITAFGWLSFPIRAFAPMDLRGAASYLGHTAASLEPAIRAAVQLAPRVGGSTSVDAAAHALAGAQG